MKGIDPRTRLRIGQIKRQCIRAILRILKPKFWPSGYNTGKPSRPLLLVTVKKPLKSRSYHFNTDGDRGEMLGFTEEGVMTDAEGGGMLTAYYEAMCLEDLIKLRTLVKRLKPESYESNA